MDLLIVAIVLVPKQVLRAAFPLNWGKYSDTEKIPELGSCGGEEENTGRWCHLEVFLRRRRLKFLVGEAPPTDPLWHELRCFHGDCRTGGCTETCGWSWHTECLFSSTLPWSVSGKLQFVSVLVRLKVSAESSRHLLGQWESSASLRLKWRFRPLPPPPSSLVSSTEKTLLFPGTFPLLLRCLDHLCLPLGFVRIYEWPRVECGAGLHGSWKKISTKLQTTDDKCGWLSAKQETLLRIIFKGFFSSISNK